MTTLRERARALPTSRWAPLVLFVLAPLVVFPASLLRTGLMDGGDDALSNLPYLVHSARQLLHGEVLWTTDLWMGMPMLEEPELATFYLPHLPLPFLSLTIGFGLYVGLHYVVAEIGAYLYARAVGLSRLAAVFGALAFAFSGFMLGHRGHTMYVVAGAWTPFVLLGLHRALEDRDVRGYVAAAIGWAAIVFAGAVQLAAYLVLLVVVLHAALAWSTQSWRPLQVAALALIPGGLIASIQILPALGSVSGLASEMRASYAFSTELSWNPAMLPTLVVPESPASHAEFYSRCGAAVLVAALVAVSAPASRKQPLVRAWSLVALVGFVLMLGRYVPPVAHALHALPIVGVFRGPTRHNFELGTALAVLSAFGVEVVRRGRPESLRRPVLLACAIGAALALSALLARRVHPSDAVLATILDFGSDRIALATAMVALFGVAALAVRDRRGLALVVVGAMPLVESRVAQKIETPPWPPIPHALPPLTPLTPTGESPRIVPPHVFDAHTEGLTGNSVLLVPGAQHLFGYSSIAPREVAELLDLDMHGHARDLPDLVWSRLPSIFGVTHVIMPEAACGELRASIDFGVDPEDGTHREECVSGIAVGDAHLQGEGHCRADLSQGARSFEIVGEVRKTSASSETRASIGLWAVDSPGRPIVRTTIASPTLTTELQPIRAPIDLTLSPPRPRLMLEADGGAIEARNVALADDLHATLVSFDAAPRLVLVDARQTEGGTIVVGPATSTAEIPRAEAWFDPPTASTAMHGAYRLVAEARAVGTGTGRCVVDVYADGFDPDAAQLVVDHDALGDAFHTFTRAFELDRLPAHVSVRAMAEGGGVFEVRAVRLESTSPHPIVTLGASEVLRGTGFEVDGNVVRVGANRVVAVRVSPPMRAVTVTVDVESSAALDAPLVFGVAPVGGEAATEGTIDAADLVGRRRASHTVLLSADVLSASPYVRTDAHLPISPIVLHSVAAEDACNLRHYRALQSLGAGLILYRNLDARPRVFTVEKLVVVRDLAGARAVLRDDPSFDPSTTAVIEGPGIEGLDTAETFSPATLADVAFDGSTVDFVVDVPRGRSFVVVDDRYHAGWEATLDGAPIPLFRTNALVRGLVVPMGHHRVHLEYRAPPAVVAGIALLGLGVLLLVFARRIDRRLAAPPLRVTFTRADEAR